MANKRFKIDAEGVMELKRVLGQSGSTYQLYALQYIEELEGDLEELSSMLNLVQKEIYTLGGENLVTKKIMQKEWEHFKARCDGENDLDRRRTAKDRKKKVVRPKEEK